MLYKIGRWQKKQLRFQVANVLQKLYCSVVYCVVYCVV